MEYIWIKQHHHLEIPISPIEERVAEAIGNIGLTGGELNLLCGTADNKITWHNILKRVEEILDAKKG